MRSIDAAALKGLIRDRRATPGRELAIVDAREEGEFGAEHLFWAVPLPLSRLELGAPALLPNPGVPVVVLDDGGVAAPAGLAETAAARLESMGYRNVAVLDGGTPAWKAAGGELFSGVNVPSKAFGEWVEHHYGTPAIDAAELKALIDSQADMVILDSRPMAEFRRMSIPGGINVPGAELAFRIGDLAPRPETLVVVNCAGRTRSIMGAESLRAAGVPNRVVALRNGTMGFELAGFVCAHGASARFAPGLPRNVSAARAAAERLAQENGVGMVDAATLAAWRADASRTTYVLDVREEDEFLAGRVPGSRHAPGGQLVQSTDAWIGVLGARIVLVDLAPGLGGGVRSRMTAQWLAQMGHRDVHVLDASAADLTEAGPAAAPCPEAALVQVAFISPEALAVGLDGTVMIDLARSIDFRAAHIPGSLWGVRTRLAGLARQIAGRAVVLLAPSEDLARLAVAEVRGLGASEVSVLAGGLAAWKAAGLVLAADRAVPPDPACIDWYLRAYDRNEGVQEAMRAYLDWEVALPEQVARDGDVAFGTPRR